MDKEPLTKYELVILSQLKELLKLDAPQFHSLTAEQKFSAARVLSKQGAQAVENSFNDEFLGIKFPHIFIGIEKDGYAHS